MSIELACILELTCEYGIDNSSGNEESLPDRQAVNIVSASLNKKTSQSNELIGRPRNEHQFLPGQEGEDAKEAKMPFNVASIVLPRIDRHRAIAPINSFHLSWFEHSQCRMIHD